MLILLKTFCLSALINFVGHLKLRSYGVVIILLIREICLDQTVGMKSIPPLLGWFACSGKWLEIQWHSVFFYLWHMRCVTRSTQSVYSLAIFVPILKWLVLKRAQRYFSHGCQFKSRCFGFPEWYPQKFLRSELLGRFLWFFLVIFIPRNHSNVCFGVFLFTIFTVLSSESL